MQWVMGIICGVIICGFIVSMTWCFSLTYVRSIINTTGSNVESLAVSPTLGDIALCSNHGLCVGSLAMHRDLRSSAQAFALLPVISSENYTKSLSVAHSITKFDETVSL